MPDSGESQGKIKQGKGTEGDRGREGIFLYAGGGSFCNEAKPRDLGKVKEAETCPRQRGKQMPKAVRTESI